MHLAEEVVNAQLTIPRAICTSMIVDGIVGFAMMVTILYCLGDVNSVLQTPTKFPFIQIFSNSVKSVGGAIGMSVVVLVLTWGCSTGILTTASRMTWAFARDHGTPFSRYLSKVSDRHRIPIVSVLTVSVFAALLVLIYIGSDVAFDDVISLTITGFYGSYLLPCALLLYHRVKGHIRPRGNQGLEQAAQVPLANVGIQAAPEIDNASPESRFVWGPWRLPNIVGIMNNAYACVYMTYVIFWSVWPPATPVSANTMNYSIVVTGGVMILSGIWYMVRGHREYDGPVVEI